MVKITDINTEQLMKIEKNKEKKILTKKNKKQEILRQNKERKEQLNKEERERITKLEQIISNREDDMKQKQETRRKIETIEKKEQEKEEEALKTTPDTLKGVTGEIFGKFNSIASGLLGLNKGDNRPLTKENVGSEIKDVIDDVGKSQTEKPSFFTQLGRNVVGSYTDTAKDLVNTVTGSGDKEKGNAISFKKCDTDFVNNFDTLYLSCDRPNLINVYNLCVDGLKKQVNHFKEDTRNQILLLEPIEFEMEKKPTKLKEPLQTGGRKTLKKYMRKVYKKKSKKSNKCKKYIQKVHKKKNNKN
jgi:hypothetical protein